MVFAASGILLKNKKVFLIKRSGYTKAFPNCWAFPGGRAEKDETPEMAVIREVKEEINIEFKPKKLYYISKWKDRQLYRFLGSFSGNIKLQDEEIADSNWFTYEEAIGLDLAFDYRDILEHMHKDNLI